MGPRRSGGEPVQAVGKAYSDDARYWSASWGGLGSNTKLISFATPRLGIGVKPTKVYARGNELAGPPPQDGLWIESWDEASGKCRRVRVPTVSVAEPKEVLGVPKPRGADRGTFAHKIAAAVSHKLDAMRPKRLAWDEIRAAVPLGPASVLHYASMHAWMEHGQIRGYDTAVVRTVAKGGRYPVTTTPYGIYARETDGGLGIRSLAVERVGAVARGLEAALLRSGMDGEAVRTSWETVVAHPVGKASDEPRSALEWADGYLAGYGLYVRDANEKAFARFMDNVASADWRFRQKMLEASNPTSRARAARWCTTSPVTALLRDA